MAFRCRCFSPSGSVGCVRSRLGTGPTCCRVGGSAGVQGTSLAGQSLRLMSALLPKAVVYATVDRCLKSANKRHHAGSSLFQSGLAHAVEKFGHWSGGIGNVLLNPCDRNVRLQFLELLQSPTRLIDLIGLCKAGDVNAVSPAQSPTLLDGPATERNRFGIMSCEIVSSSYCHIKYRVLRIVWAHANSLLGMCDRLLG